MKDLFANTDMPHNPFPDFWNWNTSYIQMIVLIRSFPSRYIKLLCKVCVDKFRKYKRKNGHPYYSNKCKSRYEYDKGAQSKHDEIGQEKSKPNLIVPIYPNRGFHNGVGLTIRGIIVHRKLGHSRFSLLYVFIITNKNEISTNIFMTFSFLSSILKLKCGHINLISIRMLFMKREFGSFEVLGDIHYFVPGKIPPVNPPLVLSTRIMELYGNAMHGLGKLNELSKRLRSPERFVKAYIIKEALMSSSIEGIHTTLLEVYTQTIDNTKPNKATQLVLNYTESLNSALSLMKELPISSRVVRSAHEVLMSKGAGDKFNPGEYRQQSVKVGYFYPALPKHVPQLMADLEEYINMDTTHPPLIKSAIAHLQFETIHPFLDGNGRIGRLLILLMLIDNRLLSSPILYPSFHFKKRQAEYYLRLSNGNIKGEFEEWIEFYLEVLEASCSDAYRRALEIEQLEVDIMKLFQSNRKYHRYLNVAEAVLPFLFDQPVFSITQLAEYLNRTYNATQNFLSILIASELVLSDPVKKQNRLFRFQPYLEILEREYGIH
jgi:Fic family protein